MTEEQGRHRRFIEKVLVLYRSNQSMAGTLGGIALGALGMYFGYDLLMHDKNLAGFAAMFVPIGALIWAFRRTTEAKSTKPGK